jgi:hypothetical protein
LVSGWWMGCARGLTYIHADGDNHQLRVEAYEGLVLCQTDLVDKSDLDDAQEVPVEAGVDDEDKDLGDLVPDIVDVDKDLANGRRRVGGDPDGEDGNVDGSDDDDGSPFDVADSFAVLGDECNSIDDDLHEQLDFKDPEKEDEEQHGDTGGCQRGQLGVWAVSKHTLVLVCLRGRATLLCRCRC